MTKLSQWDWVNLGDREGRVDHPSAAPTWLVPPEVKLEGEWLIFRRPVRASLDGPRTLERRRVSADTSLLTKFVQLDEAPAERILAYARQHGPFGFCEVAISPIVSTLVPAHRHHQLHEPVRPFGVKLSHGGATLRVMPAACSTRQPNYPKAASMM